MQRNIEAAYAALTGGRFAEARALAEPVRAEAAGALLHGLAGLALGDAAAPAALARIAAANPGARHPALDLAELLARSGRDAAPALRAALTASDDPALWTALGVALAERGPCGAAEAFAKAASGAAAGAAEWSNLGKALAAEGRFEEAWAAFGRMRTTDPQLRLNHAVALLKAGRWAEGWEMFRARHALPGRAAGRAGPELRQVEEARGRRVVLVHGEGLGDTLQFIRYARDLPGEVVVSAPEPLRRLLEGNGFVLGDGEAGDAWCRIADLPSVFGETVASLTRRAPLPYLRADAGLAAAWAERLPEGRRVGLVWAGASRRHDPGAVATDRQRSIDPALLGPLLEAPVRWVSLQQGRAAPAGVFDPMQGVRDFADTAAIVAALDMVVSVDTAVAHLAAAMGKRVLLLDRYDACWRWLTGRRDSPWYPGAVEIVRQPSPGAWEPVLRYAASTMMR